MNQLSPINPKKISLKVITFFIILVGMTYLSIGLFSDIDSVSKAVNDIPISLYSILLLLSLLSYFFRLVRWLFFLSPLKPQIIKTDHALIYFSGFALTTTPGKVGETVRSLYLFPLGIAYPVSLAAFFSERLLDVFAVMMLSMLAISSVISVKFWYLSVVFLFLIVFLFIRSGYLNQLLKSMGKKRPILLASEFQKSVRHFLRNNSLFVAFPLSLSAWLCQGIILVLIVHVFNPELDVSLLIGIYCLSILVGAASFIPGGLGATEVSISLLLINIGLPTEQAIVASIVSRVVTLWFAIVIGVLSLLSYSIKTRKTAVNSFNNLK